mmetsp:Transcript_13215/g.36519  ORF Transcript_13215/g.36519 Transcript_13215/m.36519 type:complete len:118 (-) Transcript_13215:202-555(-)
MAAWSEAEGYKRRHALRIFRAGVRDGTQRRHPIAAAIIPIAHFRWGSSRPAIPDRDGDGKARLRSLALAQAMYIACGGWSWGFEGLVRICGMLKVPGCCYFFDREELAAWRGRVEAS